MHALCSLIFGWSRWVGLLPIALDVLYLASCVLVDTFAINSQLGIMPVINTVKSVLKSFADHKAVATYLHMWTWYLNKLKQDQPMKHWASHGSSWFYFTSICLLNSRTVPETSINAIWAGLIAQEITQESVKNLLKHQIWTFEILSWSAQCLQHTLDLLNPFMHLEVAWLPSTLILSPIFKQKTYKCSNKSVCLPNCANMGTPHCSGETIQGTELVHRC